MSSVKQRAVSDGRPSLQQGSKSFSRMPATPATPAATKSPRKRANTLQDAGIPGIPEARHIDTSPEIAGKSTGDVFENGHGEEEEEAEAQKSGTSTPSKLEMKLPSTLDDLPVEIKSIADRFLESLNAKVHPTPLTADALSDLFQDFYERAAAHIDTHIAALASKIGRKRPLEASARAPAGRARAGSNAKRGDSLASGGELLTASEVAERKKARRALELKRIVLEEAVERVVCQKIYPRIFRHRSTDDEERDEKLRSRTAALSLVGIGLKELHMDGKEDLRKVAEEKEEEIHASLADAREALQAMDGEHFPAGKLQHLTAAHKSIVETLSQIFPSSSADEILPTLIYTLITTPTEGINVVSNLNFIQRFRASGKVDGEAAYCLVNLEAAISFIETVDLSSLRADELPEGPPKSSSGPTTPDTDRHPSPRPQPSAAKTAQPTVSALESDKASLTTSPQTAGAGLNKALPSPSTPATNHTPNYSGPRQPLNRPLSHIVQQQADRLEAGRENFLQAADKVYDSVNSSLESSLQFVFGRFKDQVTAKGAHSSPLPKTLEEARALVSRPSLEEQEDGILGSSPATEKDDPLSALTGAANSKKMLELVGGKGGMRDRSVDSTRSGGSGKRVAFTDAAPVTKERQSSAVEIAGQQAGNLFNAINPLNRFGVPGFARFGRSASGSQPQPSPTIEKPLPFNRSGSVPSSSPVPEESATFPALERRQTNDSVAVAEDDDDEGMNAREALAELRRIRAPNKRFESVKVGDLRVGEVEELLLEYQRLARALRTAVAR